ncbi:ABC transporter substrate-binding protein [Sediminivirga luteola]|uniref:ABC transporter substrate-binding protein n=1 Tax=Sediminivirga luteola TaxID=1774748 RepID=A0A8J2XL59_9MICO|nr:ABC transporter substrate-binding protein [Sediminivirga luteola]GGA19940.1 ABC transporter substrate-binding protein [Sediminivirga luteola]
MRRIVSGVALIAASAVLLHGCAAGGGPAATGDAGEPVEGGDFVSALYLEPRGLDPHRQVFWETYRVSRHIFEPLVQEDLTQTEGVPDLQPALAESWESSDDGRTWTFTLRQDATFHDGSRFDAEAVHQNVQRVWDEDYEFYDEEAAGRLQVWFGNLSEAQPVDDFTYEFTFSEPFLGFPRILAQSMYTLPIGNPAVWEEHGNDAFADQPEGTGPYRFVSRAIGDRIELERNEDYYGDRPYLDTLTFRIIPNNQTRVASLLNNEVDHISYVQPDDVETLENAGFNVPEGTGAQLIYLSFNYDNPQLQDERVRKALIHGLDREALAEQVFNGYASPQYSFLPPGNEAYDPAVRDFEYDPEAARELLADAGYEPGELHFNLVVDVANENLAQWLQDAYGQIGVETEIVSLDRVSYSARVYNSEEGDGLSLDEFGETNAEWLFNGYNGLTGRGLDQDDYPEVTEAIQEALYTDDEDARIQQWQEAEALLRENALVIPAVNLTRYYATGPNVQGFTFASTNWYDLSTVWLSE